MYLWLYDTGTIAKFDNYYLNNDFEKITTTWCVWYFQSNRSELSSLRGLLKTNHCPDCTFLLNYPADHKIFIKMVIIHSYWLWLSQRTLGKSGLLIYPTRKTSSAMPSDGLYLSLKVSGRFKSRRRYHQYPLMPAKPTKFIPKSEIKY